MSFNFNFVHIASCTKAAQKTHYTALHSELKILPKIQLSVICPHMVDFAALVTYYILSQ